MTFLVLLFMLLLYYNLRNKNYESGAKTFIFIVSVLLILLSGLRHEGVGNDTYAYIMNYENNADLSWKGVFDHYFIRFFSPADNGEKDPGYLVFVKMMHTLHLNSRFYLFVIAVILITPLGFFIYHNSSNLKTVLFSYSFYLILFYGYLPNSAVRQSLALSFILWAYLLLMKNKLITCICLITIGSMFHKSALITLTIIPFLYTKNIQAIYKWILLPFVGILMFPEAVAQFLVSENEIYLGYSSGTFYSSAGYSRPYMIILLITFFYFLGWIYLNKINRYAISKQQQILFLGCAYTFMLIPLIWVNPSALRIISYFGPCMAIVVGSCISKLKEMKLLFPLLILVFFYKSISQSDNYHFMWEKMEMHDRYAEYIPVNSEENSVNYI